ncbi:Uncharacterised protein [Mycobacteroides abscessus subsp. abscessus]|nr:Uncharacterised protein [Mycobacteroides abscessus subsp. abscessus]
MLGIDVAVDGADRHAFHITPRENLQLSTRVFLVEGDQHSTVGGDAFDNAAP